MALAIVLRDPALLVLGAAVVGTLLVGGAWIRRRYFPAPRPNPFGAVVIDDGVSQGATQAVAALLTLVVGLSVAMVIRLLLAPGLHA